VFGANTIGGYGMLDHPVGWDGSERRVTLEVAVTAPDLWLAARAWVDGLHDAELLLWLLATSRVKLHAYLNSENHRLYAVALEKAYERNLLGASRVKLSPVELVVKATLDDAW